MATELPKLSAPAQRALASIGVTTLEHLQDRTQKEIMDLHGMGKNAMGKLIEAMQSAGFEFAKR